MSTIAPRVGFPSARRLVKMVAVATAMVANQASTEYLTGQVGHDEVDPSTQEFVVGEFYYL